MTTLWSSGCIVILPLWLFLSIYANASCNTEKESHVYGDAFTCAVTLQIEHHCNLLESDDYTVHATVNGVTGPTVRYTSKTDAKLNAVYQFFAKRNVSCNCHSETHLLDQCAVTIKNCWSFLDSSDVTSNDVLYESRANHSDVSTHYCCDHNVTVSQRSAVQNLMNVIPQCFTSSPSASPTSMPTIKMEDCKGPIAFDGTRCLSGFNRSALNLDVCCKCPYPTAGHDGQCEPCKPGTEPTFNRITCEEPSTFWDSAGGNVLIAVIGAVAGAIGTVVVDKCLSKKCKKEESSYGQVPIREDSFNAGQTVPMVPPNSVRSENYE